MSEGVVLFYLRLLLAGRRLVHGHFDCFIWRGYYYRSHRRVFAAHRFVVDCPVAVEIEAFFVAVILLDPIFRWYHAVLLFDDSV